MKIFSLLLLSVFVAIRSIAQIEATQYFMKSLPQVNVNNPAFMPVYKYSIGLPGLSSVAATYTNNGFSYNALVKRSGSTTTADLGQWQGILKKNNYVTTTGQVDLFRMGLRLHPKVYIQLSATAKAYARTLIPRDITALLVQASAPVPGSNTNFSPKAEGLTWLESALATAVKINTRLTLGFRIKYLKGVIDATTIASNISVTSSANSITAAADVRLRTSGVYDASLNNYSFGSEFRHFMSNNGGGIDFGATYQASSKISFAASVVDIGKIYWKNNNYDYLLNKATANYTFSGIDADKLVQGNSAYLKTQGDSISKRFDFQRQQSGTYSTWLPAKMYFSASYLLTKTLKAGVLTFGESFKGRFSHGVSASMSKDVGRWLSTTISYTVSNTSYNNIGAGLSLNFAPVQIYIVGDNLLNAPASLISTGHINSYINNTQVFSLRAGLNIVWGRGRDSDKQRTAAPRSKKAPAYIKARQRGF